MEYFEEHIYLPTFATVFKKVVQCSKRCLNFGKTEIFFVTTFDCKFQIIVEKVKLYNISL